jgi:GTP-binding protein EngB required for normal cell division
MAKNKAKDEEKKQMQHSLIDIRSAVEKVNLYEFTGTDSVIFAGPTRAGKSTIINSLLGISFEGGEGDSGTVPLTKYGVNDKGPKIGNDDVAETYVPENWGKFGSSELVMWDFPGFGDNRGVVQEITNAAFYEKVLITQKSVRVVLVVPNSFCSQENASRFNTLLDEAKIFCKEPSKSLCLVVTKNNTTDKAIKALERRVTNAGGLSNENKALVNNLIKDGKVIEFKTPTEFPVTFEKEKAELEQCVKGLTGTRVSDLTLVMSADAKLFLTNIYQFVLQMHDKDIEETKKLWNALFKAKLDEISKSPVADCYDRYIELERDIDAIEHDASVNPTDMRDNIWRKFGVQRTDFSGSEHHGGLINLPALLFLEGLMNKYNKNPVDNARTTSVVLGHYVVDKVMYLQSFAERIKAPSAEEKDRIEKSKQEFKTLKEQQEITEQKNKNGGIIRKVGDLLHSADDLVQEISSKLKEVTKEIVPECVIQ